MDFRRLLAKRWVKITLSITGVVTALGAGAYMVFVSKFVPSMPEADFPEPATALEAYRQDLDFLENYATLEKAMDDPAKRAAFMEYVTGIRQELDTMTPAKFELAVARAVAFADNPHSNVSPVGRTRRVNHLPIRTGPFQDGEFVLHAKRDHADLLGAEIVAIDGHPIAVVTDAFIPYYGGPERSSRAFSHLFITSPDLLHAQGLAHSALGVSLTLRMPDGRVEERFLDALPPVEDKRAPYGRELMDYRVADKFGEDWVHLMAGHNPPLYLAEPDEPYLYRFLDEEHGAYVKINYNYDIGGRSLKGWLDGVAADMTTRQPAFAVVDLRFNGGGTDATAPFAKRLSSLVADNGPIYVVTSRQTFSAGIGAAAQIKRFAGDRVRIVGGLVGDRLRFIANGGSALRLPNSGISVRVWSSIEDYADGCWEWDECFWFSPFFRKPGVGHLEPEISVSTDFANYAANRDAVLEAILRDVNL